MLDFMTIQLLGSLGKRVRVLRNERGVTAVEFTRALRRHGVDITPIQQLLYRASTKPPPRAAFLLPYFRWN